MNDLIARDRTAERLGVSMATLDRWVREKRLEPVRLGRRVLFEPHTVEAFIEEAKSTGGSQLGRAK